MEGAGIIVEWATEYCCSTDDHELVKAFYQLRRAFEDLSPSYLGLDETDELAEENQPWKSPLNLQRMSGSAVSGSEGNGTDQRLEPFSLESRGSATEYTRSSQQCKRKAEAGAAHIDMPALIHMLITVEHARRRFVKELMRRKHMRGSLGDQSERWQHHHAKRNTAAEIAFENVLVAVKELVVLRAVMDPDMMQHGELRMGPARAGSKRRKLPGTGASSPSSFSQESDYNATQCLAALNLMFPLEPLHASQARTAGSSKWEQRYAFPLQHVPNPRTQLHQLLCEVEIWISSAGHAPSNCPSWLASARGFAWRQLKQSCLTYLRSTQHKIAAQNQEMHPWAPAAPQASEQSDGNAAAQGSEGSVIADNASLSNDGAGTDECLTGAAATQENNSMLSKVYAQCTPDATVLERIVRHSHLVMNRFSQHAFYQNLT
ncbi:hypothetical protein EV174_001472 [Coemansia sp. RSA 2320]|nr:hypothetical protein EV174_001472 [Coemansia sp. RSA 2320]